MDDTVGALARRVADLFEQLMPERERLRARALRDELAVLADDATPVSAASVAAVQEAARRHSRHVELVFDPSGDLVPDAAPRRWPPADADAIRLAAGSVSSVRRVDGVSVVAVDLCQDVRHAGRYLRAAAELSVGAGAVVLDLRRNGGGEPSAVAMVASWLLGPDVHLSDVHSRDRVRQWWTSAEVEPTDVPAALLVGPGTYSSGEALAHYLHVRGRAVVFGERTPGAADHVRPMTLTRHVSGVVPEAVTVEASTGGSWEGVGVRPDHPCAADHAEAAALASFG